MPKIKPGRHFRVSERVASVARQIGLSQYWINIQATPWAQKAMEAVLEARRVRGESEKIYNLSFKEAQKLAAEINAEAAKRAPQAEKRRSK